MSVLKMSVVLPDGENHFHGDTGGTKTNGRLSHGVLFSQVCLLTAVSRSFRRSWHGSATTGERRSVPNALGALS